MKKTVIVLFAALIAATASYASPIAYNTEEYRLSGYFDADSVAGTDFSLEAGYGYFFQDFTEAGLLLGFGDNDFVQTFYAGGFIEYNFETETDFTPYVGSQLRVVYANLDNGTATNIENENPDLISDDSHTAAALGIYAGVKFFITEDLAITARALLEGASEEIYAEDDDVSDVNFTINVGLSYFN